MFFKRKSSIDWSVKPIHKSLNEAISSSDSPPYRIKASIERCGIAALSNYGGLILTIEGDSNYISCYPTGGVNDWVSLSRAGDIVYMLVGNEMKLGKPEPNRFEAIDFINETLEERFGSLKYKRMGESNRDWTKH